VYILPSDQPKAEDTSSVNYLLSSDQPKTGIGERLLYCESRWASLRVINHISLPSYPANGEYVKE
jgi:hypothetical protein